MSQKPEHDDGRGTLTGLLPADTQPDPAVEERIVNALHGCGVLRGGPARRPLLRPALLAAASFLAGLLLGRNWSPSLEAVSDDLTIATEPPRAEVFYIVDM